MNALEYFSDTLLPVNEAVQEALPILLRDGEPEVQRIAAILRARMREVIAAAQLAHIPTTEPDGGIYTLFPIPLTAAQTNEQLAIQLLERAGLLLHPGSLYGIEQPHLVATIINNSTPQHLRNIATLQGHQATETLSPN